MTDAQEVLDEAKAEREREQQLLRPVAEFFHDHEGKLFERYEAVDELADADSVPSDDERLLHQVVGNLATDRVDPVQSVVRDDEKYVGVVDYSEHEYWYEYVEVDDVHGRVNVGVCAQCVQDADNDSQVAKGSGSTEELAERIRDHYDAEHSTEPESVETGATLVSGTTIAGNSAIHTANDGIGSGLDADTFRGTHATVLVRPGVNYSISEPTGVLLGGFASPSGNSRGVGLDSSDCIWNADAGSDSIYELNQNGTVQSRFASPSSGPQGVGLDSSDCIWNVDSSADSIYELNQTGTVQSQFSTPSISPQGVGVDSSNCIWNPDTTADSIYEFTQTGTVQSQFASPSGDPYGVGLDSSDCIWNSDYSANSIYELNQTGTVQRQFSAPGSFSSGVGVDSSDCIWNADINAGSIYKILPQGVTLE